jgi:hypothetical protein
MMKTIQTNRRPTRLLFASLLLAFSQMLGLAGADARLTDAAAQSQSPPNVSAEFHGEVARLDAEGLKLTEAIEASLEGRARYLAAIFHRDKPKDPSQTYEFRIIEGDGQSARTIFTRDEFFFSFAELAGAENLNGTDINKDGLTEVIVQSSSGGNCWACNPIEIYQVRNHRAELIAAAPILKISDLDGDGIQELEVTDSRWEVYDDFSHAASPGASMIYTWKNGKYVYACRDFADFYKSQLDSIRQEIEKEKENVTPESDDFYVGRALSLLLTYAHSGDVQKGLSELETLLKANVKSQEQRRHRLEILTDFRTGESSKKLREMKYGDPMPLG